MLKIIIEIILLFFAYYGSVKFCEQILDMIQLLWEELSEKIDKWCEEDNHERRMNMKLKNTLNNYVTVNINNKQYDIPKELYEDILVDRNEENNIIIQKIEEEIKKTRAGIENMPMTSQEKGLRIALDIVKGVCADD